MLYYNSFSLEGEKARWANYLGQTESAEWQTGN